MLFVVVVIVCVLLVIGFNVVLVSNNLLFLFVNCIVGGCVFLMIVLIVLCVI